MTLKRDGVIVAKFWLAISAAEQLKRFKVRAKTLHKQFKITDEDWRNRKRWPAYEKAVADMIERTSPAVAPWHLIATSDKPWARVESLRCLVETIENRL